MAILVDDYSPASGSHVFTARNASGQWWNGTAFEAYNASNIATYAITATSKSLGWYQGSLNDSAVTYDLRTRAGASLATTDPVIAAGQVAVKSDLVKLTGTTAPTPISGLSSIGQAYSDNTYLPANVTKWNSVNVTGMPMPTYTQPTGFLAATFPTTVSSYAGADTSGTTTLLTRLSSGRAGNLDNLDAAISTRSTLTAANVWAYNIGIGAAGTVLSDIFSTVDQIPIGANGAVQVDVLYISGQTANAAAAVTFPTSIGTSTYAGADTAGTTTLLSRIPSTLTITAGKVDVNDKTGFALSASGLSAVSAWTVNLTGNLSGSVGSVTGSVGGNVVGSVASVTAAVSLTSAYDRAKTAATPGEVSPTISFSPTINPTSLDVAERTAIAAATIAAFEQPDTDQSITRDRVAVLYDNRILRSEFDTVASDASAAKVAAEQGRDVAAAIDARLPSTPASQADVQATAPGAGADTLTWTIDTGTQALADADAWVTIDAQGNQVVDSKRTDSVGTAIFLVDGYIANTTTKRTFYGWAQKDGFTSLIAVPLVCD